MNVKLDITLPAETIATIEEQVALGHFASADDLVQQAVEALISQDETGWEPDIERMREKIRQSLADPRPAISVEEMRDRMTGYLTKLYSGS